MKVLAIESSTHLGEVALTDGTRPLAERSITKNAEQLVPAVDDILKETATAKSEIGLIAVSSGPGFFTSLRVGAAAAKSFAYALNIPIAPVPSLEILAVGADSPPDSLVCSAIDARSGMVFWALFRSQNGLTRRLTEDRITSAEEMCDIASDARTSRAAGENCLYFAGESALARRYVTEKKPDKRAFIVPTKSAVAKASVCAVLGLKMMEEGKTETVFSFSPNYVRKDLYA